MATVNLGRIKPVFRGAYNNSTAYVIDDIVTSGGETFIAIAATTGNATSDASKWTKLAAKGTDGTDVAATLANKEISFKTNAGALDGIPIGTAGQALKVNSGATGYEFGTISSGEYSVHRIDSYSYGTSVSGTYNSSNYIDISGGNTVNFTPTSTNDFVFFGHGARLNWGNASQGGDVYLMMKASSASIGSGDTKINYNGQHHLYTNQLADQYWPIYKTVIIPCTSLSVGTTYYVEQAGATHTAGSTMTFNGQATDGSGYVSGMNRHHVNMIHYKKN